ncbi:MAG: helix-turn-helix transcriptional regulator [Calditrichaeota bacterium]|nr:helix-turn-helix transcriptional regulator [Calditrichota bacterium]
MNIKKKIGDTLKRFRTDRKMSQGELSRLSGLGRTTIAKIETGVHSPTIETLAMLAKALEVKVYEIIIESGID